MVLVVTLPLSPLQGVARFYQTKKRHVITTQTEHKCVLDSCRVLEAEGFKITYLPVQTNGLVDLEVHMLNIQSDDTRDGLESTCSAREVSVLKLYICVYTAAGGLHQSGHLYSVGDDHQQRDRSQTAHQRDR